MANIQERVSAKGTKTFRVLVRRKGQPLQTKTFKTLTEAKKWARDIETQIDKGKSFLTSQAKEKTVADMIDRFIDHTLPFRGKSSQINQKVQLLW